MISEEEIKKASEELFSNSENQDVGETAAFVMGAKYVIERMKEIEEDDMPPLDELYFKAGVDHAREELGKEVPTLRDRFAMAALNGYFSRGIGGISDSDTICRAYRMADEMLEVRERDE